jgi:predicted ArsR family transcriptional regulator
MVLSLLKDIARPHVIDLIMLLKRGTGMSVNELAAALRMSYMGVKQHCLYLEKKGYFDTWRRPKPSGGRPEKMYRLTKKMDVCFSKEAGDVANDMIQAAQATLGEKAIEPMLRAIFDQKAERYRTQLKGRTLLDRAQNMAKLRLADGCLSFCEFDAHLGLRLIEYHSPLASLVKKHPLARELETQMFGNVLRCMAERIEAGADQAPHAEFRLKTAPE